MAKWRIVAYQVRSGLWGARGYLSDSDELIAEVTPDYALPSAAIMALEDKMGIA